MSRKKLVHTIENGEKIVIDFDDFMHDRIAFMCEKIFLDAETSLRTREEKLYKCNARMFYNEKYPYYVFLESYETTVAFYNIEENILYIRGRYSNTTYQHIAKFKKWICEKYHPVDRFGYRNVIETHNLMIDDNWGCYS